MLTTQPTSAELHKRIKEAISGYHADEPPFTRAQSAIKQSCVLKSDLNLDGDSQRVLASVAAAAYRESFAVDTLGIEAIARAIQIYMLEGL